ncbi:hypothetical protein, partial [Lysinibacillus sp. GbtcB16]|uniref:hypothetical protein n=1 Tax=Lysinibacillus sp. GbtcB16 TaxID=2824761 RepID=UPI001C311145
PNLFEVYSLAIIKSPIYEVEISGQEFLNRFSNINDINEYTIKDSIVRIHTYDADAHIFSSDLLTNAPTTIRIGLILQEFLFVVMSLIIVFFNRILRIIKNFLVIIFDL